MARTARTAQAVLELLNKQHLITAQEILSQLKIANPKLNKTTVYRVLDQMMANKSLCRHYIDDGQAYYELSSNHHDHFVCENCKKVSILNCPHPNIELNQETHHHLMVYGLCQNCQPKA